jgi:YD repeat-containing protein
VPAAFLTDPATQFPVTVDPLATLYASADTYVASNATTTNYGSDTGLRVGTFNAGATVGRSLLAFPSSSFAGTKVTAANLHLYQYFSQSCTGSTMNIKSPNASWSESGATWANQPALASTVYGSINTALGFSTSCPANWMNGTTGVDVTTLVDGWASGSITNNGVALVAANEADSNTWRSIYSTEYSNSAMHPYLSVTYDHYPNKASGMFPTGWLNGYVNTTTPALQLTASDPDGGNVFGQFSLYEGGTQVYPASGFVNGSTVLSGQASKWNVPSGAGLLNDHTYHIVAQVSDASVHSTAPTASATWTVDNVAPSVTTVSSTQFPANVWTNGVTTGTFTFTSTDTHFDHYLWDFDRPSPTTATATGVSSLTGITVPDGWHHLYARAVDKAGNLGPVQNYAFGANSALISPIDGQVTSQSVDLVGSTAPGATQASFYWRRSASDGWALLPTANVTPASGSPAFSGWPYSFTALIGNGAKTPTLRWDLAGTATTLTGPVQVGVCFGTATVCPASPGTSLSTSGVASTVPANVILDRNAFNVAETSSLGPVGVNLLTGNTQLSASDVSVPGASGTSLSVSRTLNTATVATTAGNAALGSGHYTTTGVFGPGWTASLPVDSAGADWTGLIDTGAVLTLQGLDQSTVGFAQKPGSSTIWLPTGPDSGSLLTVTSGATGCTSGYRCFTLTDPDNVQVAFQTLTATTTVGTLAAPISFGVTQVLEPGTPGATTFTSSGGLVTRVVSPVPSGATCTDPSSNSTWTAGCTGLSLTYGTGTKAGQLIAVTYLTSTGTAPLQVDVGCWAYDSNGRLTDSWDPRDIATAGSLPHAVSCGSTPLRATHYDYDTSGRVIKITPGWNGTSSPLAGTTISYDSSSGRLTRVDQAHLDSSGTETSSIAYGVSLTPDGSHPEYRPDLTNTAAWGQVDSPDPAVGGTVTCPPGTSIASATGDLRPCSISYLDSNGRVVNTASYSGTGAAGWHLATTEYDSAGRVLRTLDPANREEALSPTTGAGAVLGLPADPVAAAAALSTVNQYTANPSDAVPDLTDTFGPYHQVTLADGTLTDARAHTHLTYDTGNEAHHPTGGSLHLVMTSTTGASQSLDAVSVAEVDQRTSRSDYEVGTDALGWTYRTPLQNVTDPSGLNLRTRTVLDAATGEVLQSRMPNDVASASPGTTAGTTISVYYSRNTISGADSDCGSKPLFDGLLCKTYPADLTPSGGAPGLITTKVNGYDYLDRATSTTQTPTGDTAHARSSTTVYGFNSTITSGVSNNPYATTPQQSATTGGLGTALPAQTTTYDATTGLPTSLSDGTTADSSSYDDFGRSTSYTENTSATGAQTNVTTVAYDPTNGRVTSQRDQHQRTTYTYNGGNDYRGLPTSTQVDVTATNNSTALWSGTFTGGYDSNGRPSTQTDPNGVASTLTRDEAGQLVTRADTLSGPNGSPTRCTRASSVRTSPTTGPPAPRPTPTTRPAGSPRPWTRRPSVPARPGGTCSTRTPTEPASPAPPLRTRPVARAPAPRQPSATTRPTGYSPAALSTTPSGEPRLPPQPPSPAGT